MSRVVVVKAWLFALGLAVGLAGMALEFLWMVWIAVGLLAGALVLRLLERTAQRDL